MTLFFLLALCRFLAHSSGSFICVVYEVFREAHAFRIGRQPIDDPVQYPSESVSLVLPVCDSKETSEFR